MLSVSLAPFAVLLEFNFALHQLPVLARPIINTAALLASDLYQLILGHSSALYRSGVQESISFRRSAPTVDQNLYHHQEDSP